MKDWELVSLDNVCKLINGRAYKQEELLKEGKYPVLRVGNFFSNRSWYYSNLELDDSKYCNDGDLLYAWSASFGPRIWQGGKVIYHYHIWKTELDQSRVFKRFLYYWFEWDTERIKAEQGVGTTMIHVTKGAMEERTLYIPPLPEQKRIVAILDEAFEGIDSAIANTEKNLANSRELFDSYLNNIFIHKGDGWEEKMLGEISIINYGYTAKASFENMGIKFLRITDIKNDSVIWDDVPSCLINESDFNKHKLINGDIVFARTGATTGKSYLVQNPPQAVAASYLIRLRLNTLNSSVLPNFVAKYFQSVEYWNTIFSGISGSAQGGFNASKLSELIIPIPPPAKQKQIVAVLDEVRTETQRLETIYRQKLAALKELKQSILQKAFTGELTADTPKTVKEEIAA